MSEEQIGEEGIEALLRFATELDEVDGYPFTAALIRKAVTALTQARAERDEANDLIVVLITERNEAEAERDELRKALSNLLDDTQHAQHSDCLTGPCPVREARQALTPTYHSGRLRMSERPSWPTNEEWYGMKPKQRRHRALVLLMDAVEHEEPVDRRRSVRVRQALFLGHESMWRDGHSPFDPIQEGSEE